MIHREREGSEMKRKWKSMMVAISLVLVMLVSMAGCSYGVQGENLMDHIESNEVTGVQNLTVDNVTITDFGIRLLKEEHEDGNNTLLSPLSVLYALAMTANGAKGDTKTQMEKTFGMPVDKLNDYLYSYMQALPQDDKYQLNLANSIWFTDDDRFTVNQDFLQCNADYYGADIYRTPFDHTTLKDINHWVKEETHGMIPKVLDRIPQKEALMYLINALAFEAEWADIYERGQTRDGNFTREDGITQKVSFMYGEESNYLEDEHAVGFLKYYYGHKYAFVALLPEPGMSVSDYVATLNGQHLNDMLINREHSTVKTSIPKFETEYSVEMSEVLKNMGMEDAFDEGEADFTALGTSTAGNIYITRVLHKTFISVGEKGTRAGAVTVVEVGDKGMAMQPEEPKIVYLNRPFVYMLIDCETNIPFFVGTMMDVDS